MSLLQAVRKKRCEEGAMVQKKSPWSWWKSSEATRPVGSIAEKSTTKKESIYPVIEQTVDKASKVVTDEFPTYDKLKELFPKAKQKRSDNGSGFQTLHQQIMNLKGWLRGIHHHCSEYHYQHYLDEFCFRANRRNTEQEIFRSLMTRIASTKSKTFKELRAFAA